MYGTKNPANAGFSSAKWVSFLVGSEEFIVGSGLFAVGRREF
jgi:hypothetical protein